MSLFDIVYLDAGRLESFTSQHERGLRTGSTHHEVAGSSMDKSHALDGSSVTSRNGETITRISEVKVMDDRLRKFLEDFRGAVLDINHPSADESLAAARSALGQRGCVQFVSAHGPLFFDDFGSIADELARWVDATRLLAAADPKAKHNQSAQAQNYMKFFAQAAQGLLGDIIECGVDTGNVLVRAILDRRYLREPSTMFVRRYGSHTQVDFTLIGMVSRVSGEEMSPLLGSDAPAELRADVLKFRDLLDAQRRNLMVGAVDQSIHLVPLALYRSLAVTNGPASRAL